MPIPMVSRGSTVLPVWVPKGANQDGYACPNDVESV